MRKSDRARQAYVRQISRLFQINGEWFVRTRERERGPFRSREDALRELDQYADTMEFIEEHEGMLPANLNKRDVTIVDVDRPRYS